MTNKPTELVPTQADRSAVANLARNPNSGLPSFIADPVEAGEMDWHSLVQAFAAHRLASPASEDEVERVARAIHEAEPTVGVSWADWIIYATAHPDHMRDVKHTRRQARAAIAALRPRSEREEIVAWLRHLADEIEQAAATEDVQAFKPIAALIVQPINTIREIADAIERGDFKEPGE